MSDWYSKEHRVTGGEPPPDHWILGYFHATHYNWDGKTWARNFHELRTRDIALFALGEMQGKRILDVACGDASYIVTMAKMGAHMSGQDISAESLERARQNLQRHAVHADIKNGNAINLQFPSDSFDAVFSADFFEHIDRDTKRRVISEIYRVLKPGGVLVIKTPNLAYLQLVIWAKRLLAVLRLKSPFIYIAHTRNNPDCEHQGLSTYSEMAKLLDETFFHSPTIWHVPLVRPGMPRWLTRLLLGSRLFTEHIIISTRKSLFVGLFK